ncbi:MAG: DnaA regulatory inactivator Hda [Methylobacter tundripaludum]|uniref:Regulatory inactivation of DnaA Hda protein n=1 Tax=Methylobacter tundripaludum TaxID=173365 RepID=A0A2S6H307_9GAMM|nr:DnaA regulatory inactivator Hda [Methylobacter tundripaludum]MCK9635710.1 DnaA regulatory inactivator Hda [Methylobacter tundripaludum]PPK71796.1 regulatory inactivation of DnaA Hda protein [Methylobacter tundripaludum]
MAEQLPLHFEFRANQTFNDFFPGTNREIVTHLQRCVAGLGEQQIFLWGKSGLGKTHLLQACCHQAQRQNIRSFYFDLAHAELPDPAILDGLDEYDVVCFDNIECIAGNADWELAFFNFFNRHRDRGHKLIVSSCAAPNDLAIRLPDLKTRLNWGLALKIQPLTDSDRIAALIFKADQMGFEIAPQTGRFLLTHYDRDLAGLWALLEKLDKASLAAKRKLTVPFLKQILNEDSHD